MFTTARALPSSAVMGTNKFWGSRERLKLETSDLARRRTAVSCNEKKSKLGQKGSCGGHVTQFRNFGTPLISRERLKLETSNLARRRTAVSSNEKNSILGQKESCGVTCPKFDILGHP